MFDNRFFPVSEHGVYTLANPQKLLPMHQLRGRVGATVPVDALRNLADRRVELLLDVLTLAGDDFKDGVV